MDNLIRKSDVLKLIHETGGCDASDSYDRGWDECANHLYSEVESMKPANSYVKIECHCKDCIHVDYAGCMNTTCYCMKHGCFMQEDDFCKYAEMYKAEAEQALAEMKGE